MNDLLLNQNLSGESTVLLKVLLEDEKMTDENHRDEIEAAIGPKKVEAEIIESRPEKKTGNEAAKRATNRIQETAEIKAGIDLTRVKNAIVQQMERQEIETENDLTIATGAETVEDRETGRQIARWKSPNSTIEMEAEAREAAKQTATTGQSPRKSPLSPFDWQKISQIQTESLSRRHMASSFHLISSGFTSLCANFHR